MEKKFHFYLSLDYNTGLGNSIIIIAIIILIIIIIIIIGLYHSKANIEPFYVVPAKDIIAVKLELGKLIILIILILLLILILILI